MIVRYKRKRPFAARSWRKYRKIKIGAFPFKPAQTIGFLRMKGVHFSAYMNEYCLLRTYTWEDFCNYIRSVNRYHSNHINQEKLKQFFQNFKQDLRKGDLYLHRARVGNSKGFEAGEMAAPPPEKLSVGRANSRGIQCLYLTNSVITSLHEIRARELDYVTIADFELNKDISLVDLSYMDDIGPFSCVNLDCTWYAVNIGNIQKHTKWELCNFRSEEVQMQGGSCMPCELS